jgi:uncharacterized membrane protein
MDELAEKLAKWFGSAPFIIFHIFWFITWVTLHFVSKLDPDWSMLTIVVSLEAIFLSLFILRAENVQAERQEQMLKLDMKHTKEDLKHTKKVLRKIDSTRKSK